MQSRISFEYLRRKPTMRKLPPLNIRLIVNPAAGRGRARRHLSNITRAFAAERIADVVLTQQSGDEALLAAQAISDGIDTIVAVGGDGTCARIGNTILSHGSSCRLAVVPAGTGNDFAKTLGVASLGHSAIARLCAETSIARMDVGKVDDLYFLNGCGFGIDPEILAATLRVTRLRGNAVYIWCSLTKLFSYPGLSVIDSKDAANGKRAQMMITVSNGRNLGGAFKIAPQASVCDGLLDVHTFGDASPARRLKIFLAAFGGNHPNLAEVSFDQRASMRLTFETAPAMEVDGELHRADAPSVWIECVPGALSVVAAPGFPF